MDTPARAPGKPAEGPPAATLDSRAQSLSCPRSPRPLLTRLRRAHGPSVDRRPGTARPARSWTRCASVLKTVWPAFARFGSRCGMRSPEGGDAQGVVVDASAHRWLRVALAPRRFALRGYRSRGHASRSLRRALSLALLSAEERSRQMPVGAALRLWGDRRSHFASLCR